KTYANQLKAAAILEKVYADQPEHPGVAHYLIHSYDFPPIAQKGLPAARRYASIAPVAPHAQHMPSHIFTRLGYWDESIQANRRSMDLERTPQEKSHAADYMVYAYLQKGMDDSAKTVIDGIGLNTANLPATVAVALAYNPLAMQARYMLERDDWKGAAALTVVNTAPQGEAVTHFARGLGAARSGDAAEAKAEVEALNGLVARLTAAHDPYWPIVIDAQRMAVEAWIA